MAGGRLAVCVCEFEGFEGIVIYEAGLEGAGQWLCWGGQAKEELLTFASLAGILSSGSVNLEIWSIFAIVCDELLARLTIFPLMCYFEKGPSVSLSIFPPFRCCSLMFF